MTKYLKCVNLRRAKPTVISTYELAFLGTCFLVIVGSLAQLRRGQLAVDGRAQDRDKVIFFVVSAVQKNRLSASIRETRSCCLYLNPCS